MRTDVIFVGFDVVATIGFGEKAMERPVIRQMANGGLLEFVERDVGRIEVYRRDLDRRYRQIAQYVATTRGNRDKMIARLQIERLQVDDRIFPDLRIDES